MKALMLLRDWLIGYLRWSARRHWTVKVVTAVVILPIFICTPGQAWDRLIADTFEDFR